MKKLALYLLAILVVVVTIISLVGCDMPGDLSGGGFDNENITPVPECEGYYRDDRLAFCAEIRGSYGADRPFTLDAENEDLRIWDNMYLYEYDYFQMIASGTADIFYSVKSEDMEYVTIDDSSARATIAEGKSGIYKVTFDIEEKIFDLEYKGEITSPRYEKMDGCDVYSLSREFVATVPNPNNGEELMLEGFAIQAGELISFHNHGDVHLSSYKVILDEGAQGKYASAIPEGDKHISFAIGGIYNLYINPTTYVVRVELTNPDTADYSLMVYENGEPVSLTAPDDSQPYLFTYQRTMKRLSSVPILVSKDYLIYELSAVPSDAFIEGSDYFVEAGTYIMTINLKTFEVSAERIPE